MVSEDIPGGLVQLDEFKKRKRLERIEEASRAHKRMKEGLGNTSDIEALYLRLEDLENRFMNLVEYTQDLYLVAKQQEQDLLVAANRIEFLVNALGKLTVWTGYPK